MPISALPEYPCRCAQCSLLRPWSIQPSLASLRTTRKPPNHLCNIFLLWMQRLSPSWIVSYLYLKNLLVLLSGRLERSWVLFSVDTLPLSSKNLKKNWTGNNICLIFCKNATMRLFRGNYKYCFLFLHNPWRGSASLQSPLITSCCESLAEQCVSWLHQMDLICVAVHSHDRQQMECSLRQHFAAWSWCLMNYGDK